MKKEELKEILVKAILGFLVGVLLLMISYICIYFVAGQTVYENEINQLKNIETLIGQIFASGIAGGIFITMFTFMGLFNRKYKVVETKAIIKLIINCFILMGGFFIAIEMPVFSENIADMNVIIYVLTFTFTSVIYMIVRGRDEYLINKKIKELNKLD